MLTLTRKPGESIFIGDEIEVLVKEIRHGAIRLGFEAPQSIEILRGELYRKLQRERELRNPNPTDVEKAVCGGDPEAIIKSGTRGY